MRKPFTIDDTFIGWALARIVEGFNQPTSDECHKLQIAVWRWAGLPQATNSVFFPAGPFCPAFVVFAGPFFRVVMIRGTDSASQAVGYANPVALHPLGGLKEQRNLTFDFYAGKVLEALNDASPAFQGLTVVGGHSYGGGVATCLARRLAVAFNIGPVELITWGAPRVGSADFLSPLGSVNIQRFMAPEDPVPFLPPHEDEVPPGVFSFLRSRAVADFDWEQPGGGFVLYDDGRTLQRRYSPDAPHFAGRGYAEYSRVLLDAVSADHTFINYRESMRLRYERLIPRQLSLAVYNIEGGIVAPGLLQPVPIAAVRGQLVTLGVEQSRNGAGVALASVAPFPPGGAFMQGHFPTSASPTLVRISADSYTIYWMTRPVLIGLPRGSANATLKKFRAWLRRLPVGGEISAVALSGALSDFLALALAGGQDWAPPYWPVS